MKNNDQISEYDDCPVHGGDCKKVYRFGQYEDAEIYVYHGCRCAVAVRFDPVGQYQPVATWHPNYNEATGQARFHKAMMNAKYA